MRRQPQIYIIQTNTSLDDNYNPQDFQSMIYGYSESWDEFKTYLLSSDTFTEKLISGTMTGYTKPQTCIIEQVLINDDHHVEIILSNWKNSKCKSQYMLVSKEVFEQFKHMYDEQ